MRKSAWAVVCAAALWCGRAEAGDRTVCASGCQYTTLQAAIDAAAPGDTILLRAGETFVGHVRLRAKPAGATAYITIRSDAPAASLPAAGVRLVPEGKPGANVARRSLARLLGRGDNYKSTPIIVTEPGAHHYRLMFLEIDGTAHVGYETLAELGSLGQTSLSSAPHSIVFDRVYFHGHASKGMKRGIALNSRSTDILNSYFSEFMSFQDAQAIAVFNGPGPFRIINNHLEAAAENIMFGGADPRIVNLIPGDAEIRGNYFYKNPRWRDPILAAPARPTLAAAGTGSLAAGTHYFRVVASIATGGSTGLSAPSAEASVTVSAGRAVTVKWNAVVGADKYRVYRGTAAGAQTVYLETTTASTTFTYTGTGEKAGAPKASGAKWTVKNLIEVKNGQRITINGNVFENNWAASQTGFAIAFTPRNQEGTAPWTAVRDVTFTNNVVRHVAAGIKILGTDYDAPTQQTRNIRIAGNRFEDVNRVYGNTGRFLLLTSGPANITVDNNTIFHTGTLVEIDGPDVLGFVFTNNKSRHNTYGVKGQNYGTGLSTLDAYFPGYVFVGNVLAGGPAALYPKGNFFPSVAQFESTYPETASTPPPVVTDDPPPGGTNPPPAVDHLPVADAGGPYSGTSTAAVLLDGSRSTDADAPLVSYRWQLGEDIVLRAADVPAASVHGRWKRVSVAGAAGGVALENTNLSEAKKTSALAAPANYVDIEFEAASGVPYYVWIRMKAAGDHYANDSLYVQFSGATTAGGSAIHRIGTTGAMPVVLEEGDGAGRLGWGWNDGGWAVIGAPVYFATAGKQTVRLQQREDGVMFDQIVISAVAYAAKSPGELKSDTMIVPTTLGTDTGITALHTYKRTGVYPVRLVVTDTAGQTSAARTAVTIR